MSHVQKPDGELTIQTEAKPADTNSNGDIFGGWLLSQMDTAGAVLARRVARGRVATVAINSMTFKSPVQIGDLLSCYVKTLKIGTTSITVNIEAWTYNLSGDIHKKVTEGVFVYVAIDEARKPRPVNH